MDNIAKEKLPNFRDDNRGALLVELCEKSIAICEAYDLYNGNGDWKTVAQAQYRALYGECKNTWQDLMSIFCGAVAPLLGGSMHTSLPSQLSVVVAFVMAVNNSGGGAEDGN